MIPGARDPEGRLYVTTVAPVATDPYLAGLRLTPIGELYVTGLNQAWSPAHLFANGEQGAWYDPSDLSTLFQDSAGTIPVTADGQPVGLMLDKSQGGWLPISGSWEKVDGDGIVSVVGDTVTITGATKTTRVDFLPANTYGSAVEMQATFAGTPVTPILYLASTGLALVSGAYRYTSGPNGSLIRFQVESGTASLQVHSISEMAGNYASQATATARPIYRTDGTYHWLEFDGIDDSLSTAAVDFTVTDKMSVFSGMLKKGTTPWQQFVELSGNSDISPGSFGVNAPSGSLDGITSYIHGATGISNSAILGLVSPLKLVFTSKQDLAGSSPDTCVLSRINGADSGVSSGAISGGGSYGDYPIFIGSRNGVSTMFSGDIYSLIVRGAASSQTEIDETEAWVNSKTGAY